MYLEVYHTATEILCKNGFCCCALLRNAETTPIGQISSQINGVLQSPTICNISQERRWAQLGSRSCVSGHSQATLFVPHCDKREPYLKMQVPEVFFWFSRHYFLHLSQQHRLRAAAEIYTGRARAMMGKHHRGTILLVIVQSWLVPCYGFAYTTPHCPSSRHASLVASPGTAHAPLSCASRRWTQPSLSMSDRGGGLNDPYGDEVWDELALSECFALVYVHT